MSCSGNWLNKQKCICLISLQRLQSLSMIQPATKPHPPIISSQPHPHPATDQSNPTLPFLWQPGASQDEGLQRKVAVSLRQCSLTPSTFPSTQHHYNTIKSLVEQRRSQARPRQLGAALLVTNHAHWSYPIQRMERSQLSNYISEIWSRELKQ